MAGVVVDVEAFKRRLQRLLNTWKDDSTGGFSGATALCVATGGRGEEDVRYLKSVSLHLYLLGYEFTDTILVFTSSEMHVLAGAKKTALLEPLGAACQEVGLSLVLHPKPKKDSGEQQMQELLGVLRSSGSSPVVGTLLKEQHTGALVEAWASALRDSGLATVEIAAGLAAAMAVKDEEEIKSVRKAALLASSALTIFTLPEIEGVIDQEKKMRHSKLAERTEEVLADPSKIKIKLKSDIVDSAYTPIIQSGGDYNFKLGSGGSSDKPIHYGVIVCSLGARYASYCANIARTYFVNPSEEQQAAYVAVQAAHAAAVAALVDGAPMSAAYSAAVRVLQDQGQPHLAERLPRNIGTAIGLELRDSSLALSAANDQPVKPGTAFNVSLGIVGLERSDADDQAAKSYGILLSDTVVVMPDGAPPEVATASTPKDWSEVAYYLDQEEADGEDEAAAQAQAIALVEPAAGLRKSARTEQVDFKQREEERRRQKENQEDLLDRVNQATLAMLNKGGAGTGTGQGAGRKLTDLAAYKSVTEMQHNNSLTVQVDHRSECVLVPIYGMLVPFHILTVKNASNNQDGEHAYIRINFNYGASYEPTSKHPTSIFLKELSFRSSDVRHAAKVVQEVKALRSSVQQRDKEKAERATLVQQEKLVRAKGRVYALPDVWIRPAFGGKGRKMTGTLEAHANGFRYISPKGEELDVMYRNIKHAFFQPSDKEMITLVHFNLHNPIMVGKKKTTDVQFYTEVMDSVQTLDAGRRSMYDPDEIEEEQRERERRNQINRQFNQFVKRVQQDVWERDFGELNLEFEIPFRELGFHGVPHRTNCFIMPTVNCLVELTEMPFTVMTLSEVNLVNLERVGFNLRNFDMIFIWKDLNRDVGRIDSIPSQSLDTIKDWLTSIEIKFYESKVNLNWKNILKSIKEDPEGFIEDGGWSFLDAEQSDSEEEGGEEESDFAPSGAEESEDVSSEEESVVESEDAEGSDYEEEESEGMDWDELEEEARREDKEQDFSDDEGARSRKKARR